MNRVLLTLMLIVSALPFMGQTIMLKNSSISDGDELSSISELTLDFDFSEVANSLGISEDNLAISSLLSNKFKYRMLLYVGSKDSEGIGQSQDPSTNDNIVGSGYKTIGLSGLVNGQHSITIPFDSPIQLTPGEKYTIFIPSNKFQAGQASESSQLFSTTRYPNEIRIEIIGKESGEDNPIQINSVSPERNSEIEVLKNLIVEFNQNIQVAEDACAEILYGGTSYATSTNMSCDQGILTISFNDIILYNGKDYTVTIPANTITSIDGNKTMDAISIIYKGLSYHYMTTGRISPSTKNPISWLSTVSIPFDFPEGYNIGNVDNVSVKIYENSMDSQPVIVPCTGMLPYTLVADVWDFNLKPSTTYYVVLDKEQIFPARSDDYRIKLKDTTNDEVILEYTTPEVLEIPNKVEMSTSSPVDNAEVESLDNIEIELAKYSFEDTFYEVKLLTENPTAIFDDGTTQTSVPLTFDAESSKISVAIKRPLVKNQKYTLTIPANILAPLANENLAAVAANDEIVLSFTGKDADTYNVVYSVVGMGSMTSEVEAGKTLSVKVDVSDNWKVKSVKFNGEDVELVDGIYTTPAITADSKIEAEYESTVVPEYISIDFQIGDYASATYRMVKGEPTTVDVKASEEWVLKSLTLDGEDVTEQVSAEGLYEVPALEKDATLAAEFEYYQELPLVDVATGVGSISECEYRSSGTARSAPMVPLSHAVRFFRSAPMVPHTSSPWGLHVQHRV